MKKDFLHEPEFHDLFVVCAFLKQFILMCCKGTVQSRGNDKQNSAVTLERTITEHKCAVAVKVYEVKVLHWKPWERRISGVTK